MIDLSKNDYLCEALIPISSLSSTCMALKTKIGSVINLGLLVSFFFPGINCIYIRNKKSWNTQKSFVTHPMVEFDFKNEYDQNILLLQV